jgi:hypothetical protein
MNKTSLAISALVIVSATAMGFSGFAATQSAVALFDTNNNASQSATQSAAAATGGASGGSATSGDNGAAASGGVSGSISISQGICQQIAQSGAFGFSNNSISSSDCS